MKIISGDITKKFTKNTDMIVHITNCVAMMPRQNSLGYSLATKFPYSNPYKDRIGIFKNLAHKDSRPQPGTVQFCFPTNHESGPIIANCFAQYRMGNYKSNYYMNSTKVDENYKNMSVNCDTYPDRLKYFNQCIFEKIIPFLLGEDKEKKQEIRNIVFPENIGCGAAGGCWMDYKAIIQKMEIKLNKTTTARNNTFQVLIIRLKQETAPV